MNTFSVPLCRHSSLKHNIIIQPKTFDFCKCAMLFFFYHVYRAVLTTHLGLRLHLHPRFKCSCLTFCLYLLFFCLVINIDVTTIKLQSGQSPTLKQPASAEEDVVLQVNMILPVTICVLIWSCCTVGRTELLFCYACSVQSLLWSCSFLPALLQNCTSEEEATCWKKSHETNSSTDPIILVLIRSNTLVYHYYYHMMVYVQTSKAWRNEKVKKLLRQLNFCYVNCDVSSLKLQEVGNVNTWIDLHIPPSMTKVR